MGFFSILTILFEVILTYFRTVFLRKLPKKLFEMIGKYIKDCPKEQEGNFEWLCVEGYETADKKWWKDSSWVTHIAPVSPHLLPTKIKHQIYESVCSAPGKGEPAFNYWSDHNLFESDENLSKERGVVGKTIFKYVYEAEGSEFRYTYKKYTPLAGEKKVRGSKAVWIMRDPRYVVVSVRRDHRTGLLCATAYDSRSANEYEVEGPAGWQKNWNLEEKPNTRETNAKPPFLTGRPHHPGVEESKGSDAREDKESWNLSDILSGRHISNLENWGKVFYYYLT